MTTKTKTQHTPGPWAFSTARTGQGDRIIADSSGTAIATALDQNAYSTDASTDANARLIAAAPDLLAVSARALDYLSRIEEGSEGAELRDALWAAIVKAGGI